MAHTTQTPWHAFLPPERILTSAADRLVYDADAVTLERVRPSAVLLVKSNEEGRSDKITVPVQPNESKEVSDQFPSTFQIENTPSE